MTAQQGTAPAAIIQQLQATARDTGAGHYTAAQARHEPEPATPDDEPQGARHDDPQALEDGSQALHGPDLDDGPQAPDEGPQAPPVSPDDAATRDGAQPDLEDDDEPHPWRPVAVLDRLDDLDAAPIEAPLWIRSDGAGLLYRRATHSISGDGGHGKSLVGLAACLDVVRHGGRAAFLDMGEDVYETTAKRLVQIGARDEDLARIYWAGIDRTWDGPADRLDWLAFLDDQWDLVVIDSVAMSLGLWGYQANDNDGVTEWWRLVPDAIAKRTGAAVLVLDHVVKNKDNRGRGPIGAAAKLNRVSGVQYQLDVVGRGFEVGGRGAIVLRVTKDRHGTVKGAADRSARAGRDPVAAVLTIDTTRQDAPTIELDPLDLVPDIDPTAGDRLAEVMAQVSAHLASDDRPQGVEAIRQAVGRKKAIVVEALRRLVDDGYVRESAGAKNARLHAHIRPYPDPGPAVSEGGTSGGGWLDEGAGS